MKSVLISIQPKWCELIASGKKTVEVRKTKPKLETPFKCYIYCTRNTKRHALHLYINSGYGRKEFGTIGHWRSGKDIVDVNPHLPAYRYNSYLAEGKVIGEFVCDKIYQYSTTQNCKGVDITDEEMTKASCLTKEDIEAYEFSAEAKENCIYKIGVYGWHISDLVIYEKPRVLSEFAAIEKTKCPAYLNGTCLTRRQNDVTRCENLDCPYKKITRPPQSWCYVEKGE